MTRKALLISFGAALLVYSLSVFIGVTVGREAPTLFYATQPVPWYTIFAHNFIAAGVMFGGTVTFGATDFIALLVQGLVQGATVMIAVRADPARLLRVLPYGPFEFAGMFVAASAGFYPLVCRITAVRPRWALVAAMAILVLVLLAVASIIEAWVCRRVSS